MRQPRQLWRDAGPGGFLTLNIVVGGNVLTALAFPVLPYILLRHVQSGTSPWSEIGWLAPLCLTAIAAGFVSTITVGLIGLARRNRLRDSWILLLTGLHWICLSIAAWRAVLHYVWNPYHWEKTEHGVAKRISLTTALDRFGSRERRSRQR
jgi:hypothetical protein